MSLETPEDLRPAHHAETGFRNPEDGQERGLADLLRWQFGFGPSEPPLVPREDVPAFRPVRQEPDWARIASPDPAVPQVTWIGHSCFLLQYGGKNFLTDPVFGRFCSPVPMWSLRRRSPLGMGFEQLPRIDAVLLSHNHYDHLEARTVRRLRAGPAFFCPLGLRGWLERRRVARVIELDWWDDGMLDGIHIHAVPARHFSGRTPFDRNLSLWAGWVIETTFGCVYFAGDSGYGSHFREIGDRFGPMRLSLLPIGAYRPRWFMRPLHVDASESVRVHREVRSELSVAMHWGTFRLTDEPLGEPPVLLSKSLAQNGVGADRFVAAAFGETICAAMR